MTMAKHVIVSGRVQGVGFRFAAKQAALKHQLVGWVHNNFDGTVELEIAGDEENIEQFFTDMKSGFNQFIKVENIKSKATAKTMHDFNSFQIK